MLRQDVHVPARDRLLDDLPVRARRVDVDGVSTSVLEGGSGPPLVLLHGAIATGGVVWWRVVARLATSHRVVVPDLPGLGESESLDAADAATLGGWLRRLIDVTCGGRAPTLVAHSAPGGVAARFAADHGHLLRRLVLVDAAGLGRFRPSPGILAALLASSARPSARTAERFLGRVVADLDRTRDPDPERWQAFVGYAGARTADAEVRQALRQVVRAGTARIAARDLRRIRVRTLLVWGRDDPLVPLALAEAASVANGWPLHVIDGAGHLPHVERPDAFAATLEEISGDR